MASNFRKLLKNQVKPRRVFVEHEVDAEVPALDKEGNPAFERDGVTPKTKPGKVKEVYVLSGMPDNTWVNLQGLEEHKKVGIGKLYSVHMKERGHDRAFSPAEVVQIMLVAHYLEAPEGEDRYSEIEVATLATEHGLLFGKLLNGVEQIIRNSDNPDEEVDPMLAVALGNSLNPGREVLSSAASTPSDNTPKQ